jgi:hypothetical protein
MHAEKPAELPQRQFLVVDMLRCIIDDGGPDGEVVIHLRERLERNFIAIERLLRAGGADPSPFAEIAGRCVSQPENHQLLGGRRGPYREMPSRNLEGLAGGAVVAAHVDVDRHLRFSVRPVSFGAWFRRRSASEEIESLGDERAKDRSRFTPPSLAQARNARCAPLRS